MGISETVADDHQAAIWFRQIGLKLLMIPFQKWMPFYRRDFITSHNEHLLAIRRPPIPRTMEIIGPATEKLRSGAPLVSAHGSPAQRGTDPEWDEKFESGFLQLASQTATRLFQCVAQATATAGV